MKLEMLEMAVCCFGLQHRNENIKCNLVQKSLHLLKNYPLEEVTKDSRNWQIFYVDYVI